RRKPRGGDWRILNAPRGAHGSTAGPGGGRNTPPVDFPSTAAGPTRRYPRIPRGLPASDGRRRTPGALRIKPYPPSTALSRDYGESFARLTSVEAKARACQTRAVPSTEAVTICDPSGLNSAQTTGPL